MRPGRVTELRILALDNIAEQHPFLAVPPHQLHHPVRAMQLMRWDGKKWVLFGDVIQGEDS